MHLYFHISYREHQLLSLFGIKKFDAFTLACNHAMIQIIYAIAFIGYAEDIGYKLDYEKYIIITPLAVILISANYFIISRKGLEALKEYHSKNSMTTRIILDVLLVLYVAGAFAFITYTRSLKII